MANYFSGTSGLMLPVPNKSHYPPEFQDSSRLTYYASLFNTIEVNSSFYRVPQAKTLGKWYMEVPDHFKFTMKFWREITHSKALLFEDEEVLRLMQILNALGDKKGCLLLQFPPSVRIELFLQLVQLVQLIREADPQQSWQIALEFRHSSWYTDQLRDWMLGEGLTLVIHDKPGSATPMDFLESDTVYLRFHGPDGRYSGSYDSAVLQEYATYIQSWLSEGKNVYVYFNNTMGEALKNLNELNAFLKS